MYIVLDFDGTCVQNEFPYVGESIGAEQVLVDLVRNGHDLILFTARGDGHLEDAIQWFSDHSLPLSGIQQHPEQKAITSSPKPVGDIIIDDKMLGALLVDDRYVNWDWAAKQLLQLEYITEAQYAEYDFSLYVF